MKRDEMPQHLDRCADVTGTPDQLRPIEAALDRLADRERLGAPDGLQGRLARATGPVIQTASPGADVTRPAMTEPVAIEPVVSEPVPGPVAEPVVLEPVVLFRFTRLRAAAAVALIATVTAAWFAMQSGGTFAPTGIEPDVDDWEQFALVSFPPLDYTSYDLFADTEQFTVSLTADMIDSDPLFEEGSM